MPRRSHIGSTPGLVRLNSPSTDSKRLFGKLSIKRGLSEEIPGRHRILGIGAGFVPALLDRAISRQVQAHDDEDRFQQRVDCRFRTGPRIDSAAVAMTPEVLA